MADITMCLNTLCPIAYSCYLNRAMPSKYQSYSVFQYEIRIDHVKCDNFIYHPTEDKKITTSTRAKLT